MRDKRGVPVPDLQLADFTVTIDGRPRQVVSAHFFRAGTTTDAPLTDAGPVTPRHITNDEVTPGRVVVFAVDGESIQNGQERVVFETASRMLDALSPADAVGLMEIPGPTIDVTRDHAGVAEALKRFRGRKPAQLSTLTISYDEALGIERNDPRSIGPVVSRACESSWRKCSSAEDIRVVTEEVKAETKSILATERGHAHLVVPALTRLLRQMSVVRAPRSVILISGGLAFEPEIVSQYKDLERAAAESRVMLYTVRLDQMNMDLASNAKPGAIVAGDPAMTLGLANISSTTGGMFFTGIGKAAGVFDRIVSEVTSFYELGLESSPADADGKEHDVKVRVSRPGLDVRAPSHLAVAGPSKAAPRDALALALQQPTDVRDVPLAIATYSTHSAAGGPVRLLVSADIGAPNGAAPAEWGLAVTQNGKGIVKTRGRIPAGSERPRVMSTTVDVPPGAYQLRVAAVDADNRAGVLVIPITAGYRRAGGTLLSDLVVGVAKGGQLEPRRHIAQADDVTAILEISGDLPSELRGTLQLIRGGTARSLLNVPLSVRLAASAGPSVLQARAALGAIPPGRYTASAVLESAGQPFARVSRVIDITASTPVIEPETTLVAAPAAGSGSAAEPPAIPVTPTRSSEVSSAGSADEIMRRVGAYVERYGGRASFLVAVEHYSQIATPQVMVPPIASWTRGAPGISSPSGAPSQKRQLVSEFALVPNASASGGWLGYRDVIEVNGKPVADRHDRLQALFNSDMPDLQEARRIADESARYNIGPVSRNFNVPTATLFFFHPANLSRFTFHRRHVERLDGIDTVAIDFRETGKPTLIMNATGADVPSSGTLWVNPVDGAVVRTLLALDGFRGPATHASIEATYRQDPALGLWVPSRMTESYLGGRTGHAATVATYTDFKRFQTSAKITIPK